MIIGIDIDGVICPYNDFKNAYGTKLAYELKTNYTLANPKGYEIFEKFNSDEIFEKAFLETYEPLRFNEPAIPFASEVIKKLKEDGHTIYIITARKNNSTVHPSKMTNTIEEFTIKYLNENAIYYDKIFFVPREKDICCSENNVDIMIEDAVSNIKKVLLVSNVIVFDAPYNNILEFENLNRAYTWYDVYNKINQLNNKEL